VHKRDKIYSLPPILVFGSIYIISIVKMRIMLLVAIKHRLQNYLLLKRQMLTIYVRQLIAHSNLQPFKAWISVHQLFQN